MTLRSWLSRSHERTVNDGLWGIVRSLYYLYVGFWLTVTSRVPFGKNVYSEDWELLIILDACRVDTLESVADEYDFIDNVRSLTSVGSTSSEWLAKTMVHDHLDQIGETAYITGNPFTDEVLRRGNFPDSDLETVTFPNWATVESEKFGELDEVWQYAHDEEYKTVLPRDITERVIDHSRNEGHERIIAHYMQPHAPFLESDSRIKGRNLKSLRTDDSISNEVIRDFYRETLREVLDEVAVLIENVDADQVVITADHGEALGEWGAYGHPVGFPHPVVKQVPWVETSANDEGTLETSDVNTESEASESVEENLKDLGYL